MGIGNLGWLSLKERKIRDLVCSDGHKTVGFDLLLKIQRLGKKQRKC
jgi:hypothetical protein